MSLLLAFFKRNQAKCNKNLQLEVALMIFMCQAHDIFLQNAHLLGF